MFLDKFITENNQLISKILGNKNHHTSSASGEYL